MFDWLLESDLWPRRWDCGSWSDSLGYSAIFSNVGIALAYFAIPLLSLWLIRRKSSLVPDRWLARLACAFVLLCGVTHLFDAAMFYWPAYRLNISLRWLTFAVSVAMLARLWFLRKRLLGFASPEEYREALHLAGVAREALRVKLEIEKRQAKRLRSECDGLRDELLAMVNRTLNDSALAKIRDRIHSIRDATVGIGGSAPGVP